MVQFSSTGSSHKSTVPNRIQASITELGNSSLHTHMNLSVSRHWEPYVVRVGVPSYLIKASQIQKLLEAYTTMLHIDDDVIFSLNTSSSTSKVGIEEKFACGVRDDVRNLKVEGGGSI